MLYAGLAAGFAAGTLLHLVLVVLVAARPEGRDRGLLDRLFLFLFGALLLWHAGNLLALTLEPFGGEHRALLITFARAVAFSGLAALSPLLAHLHIEYAQAGWRRPAWLFYLPLAAAPFGVAAAATARGIPRGPWTTGFIIYFCGALLVAVVTNARLARRASGHLPFLHRALACFFGALAAACLWAFVLARGEPAVNWIQSVLLLSSIVPSALVGFWMFRFNFLEARAQQGVALAMLGLLGVLTYALVIQRMGQALERGGYLPSTVTEGVLVFVLVVMVEPVSRHVRRWLSRQVAAELARLEALAAELRRRSFVSTPEEVRAFAAEKVSEFFGFRVEISVQGALDPQAGRGLHFREIGALRLLGAHVSEAIERSRLLSERLKLERELAERAKMASLGEMVAFIAHRLKNPLSAINALVQVIGEQSPGAAEHCDVIRGEIRRLNTAVGDLLRFTRPSAAAGPAAEAASVSPREATEEVVALFSADAARKGVALVADAAPEARVPMARAALGDVLTSLVSNALDAAPAGSRVLLGCERNGDRVMLTVEDEGPGVAPADCERIFEPFFTLKPGGTGLGLALARRRAREAGAEIRCISPARDGRGARFEVIFQSMADSRGAYAPGCGLRTAD